MMTKEEKKTYPIIVPESAPKQNFFVPEEFKKRVLLHIIKNYSIPDRNIPLFLTIQGPKGDGKSSQTREICSQHGVYVIPISGASISGAHEGDAVGELKKVYTYASYIRKKEKKLTVILIDDFDLSVASVFTNREYTVNTQLINGFLMNLADEPTRCGDEHTYRIPLIFTGNNFTGLYKPLVRHGRMDFFDWKPTLDQKIQIVSAMYSESLQNEKNSTVATIQKNLPEHIKTPPSYGMNNRVKVLNQSYQYITRRGRNFNYPNPQQPTQGPGSATLVHNKSAIPANQNPIKELVEEFSDQPISFFESLKGDLIDEVILATIEKDNQVNQDSIRQAVIKMCETITVDSLFELANKRKLMYAKDFEIF